MWTFRPTAPYIGVLAQWLWRHISCVTARSERDAPSLHVACVSPGGATGGLSNRRRVWERSSWKGRQRCEVALWRLLTCSRFLTWCAGFCLSSLAAGLRLKQPSVACCLPERLPCWVSFQSHHPTWLFLQFVCYPVG